jgi:hypothetical protein
MVKSRETKLAPKVVYLPSNWHQWLLGLMIIPILLTCIHCFRRISEFIAQTFRILMASLSPCRTYTSCRCCRLSVISPCMFRTSTNEKAHSVSLASRVAIINWNSSLTDYLHSLLQKPLSTKLIPALQLLILHFWRL